MLPRSSVDEGDPTRTNPLTATLWHALQPSTRPLRRPSSRLLVSGPARSDGVQHWLRTDLAFSPGSAPRLLPSLVHPLLVREPAQPVNLDRLVGRSFVGLLLSTCFPPGSSAAERPTASGPLDGPPAPCKPVEHGRRSPATRRRRRCCCERHWADQPSRPPPARARGGTRTAARGPGAARCRPRGRKA